MASIIRQHGWTGLVAAATILAAVAEGLFEPLGYAAAALVVWGVIAACLIGRVFEIAPIGKAAVPAGLLLAAAAGLTLLSTLWAKDQGRAFEEGVRAALYLGLFVLAACTARENARRHWLAGLAIGLAIVGFIALYAYLHPGTLDSGRTPITNAAGRLSYPIGYWNGAASLFAVAAVLLVFCAANAATAWMRSLATAVIPAMILAIWLTSSRGGLIALGIGWAVLLVAARTRGRLLKTVVIGGLLGVALILIAGQLDALMSGSLGSARRSDGEWMSLWLVLVTAAAFGVAGAADIWIPRPRVSRRLALGMLVTLIVAGAVAIVAIGPVDKVKEFTAAPVAKARPEVGVNSNGRWQFWRSAVDAFASSPVHGLGAGGWEAYWGAHSSIRAYTRNPHSLPLQSAAELGIAGIALLLGFVAVIFVAARRRLGERLRRDSPALVAVLSDAAVSVATDWTWQIPGVIAPAIVCSGLITASSRPLRIGAKRALGSWAVLAAACLAIVASVILLISDVEMRRSRAAADAGNFDEAIARARDALTVEPWAASPYLQLALLRQAQGDYPRALADLREAQARDADDWRLSLVEARLQRKYGDAAAGKDAFRQVRTTSPYFAGVRPK